MEYPEKVFDVFEDVPVASVSLAQVYVEWVGEKEVAVKVQHQGLRDTVGGDLRVVEWVVRGVDWGWEEFRWGWIVDEIAPNMSCETVCLVYYVCVFDGCVCVCLIVHK